MIAEEPSFPDYLLDTSVLSRLLDSEHADHTAVRKWNDALPSESRKVLSVVVLAELRFGLELAKAAHRTAILPKLEGILRAAEQHDIVGITRATEREYAVLKSALAAKYMPNRVQNRPNKGWGNPESWSDEFTGQALQIQENDLWQCAQAMERELIFASCDLGVEKMIAAVGAKLMVVKVPLS